MNGLAKMNKTTTETFGYYLRSLGSNLYVQYNMTKNSNYIEMSL